MQTPVTYECNGCKKSFQNNILEIEPVPDNMNFEGLNFEDTDEKGIPKCPHCGYLAFFGFKVIDIAF